MEETDREQGYLPRDANRKTYAVVLRGLPQDFQAWIDQAKIYDLFVVYTKTSHQRLRVIEEAK